MNDRSRGERERNGCPVQVRQRDGGIQGAAIGEA